MKLKYLSICLVLLALSCANQMPPAGGPDDTRPPQVMQAFPPSGSVNHGLRDKIILSFSEWIDPAGAEKSLSLFPPLTKGYTVTVNGRRMIIAPKEAFADSTTYHIELGTALKDLHGNPLRIAIQYVFSTGSQLDSATVSGCVIAPKFDGLPKAALYRHDQSGLADSALLNLPSYVTQADSAGLFRFSNIRRGMYSLIAFSDNNGDNRLNAGKEAAFAPLDRTVSLDSSAGPLQLFPVDGDTLSLRIASVKPLGPRLILAEWNSIPVAGLGVEGAGLKVVSMDPKIPAPALKAVSPLKNSRRILLSLADSLRPALYGLTYTIQQRLPIIHSLDSLTDTLQFNGMAAKDTVPPQLQTTQPKGTTALQPDLRLIWSEPVRSAVASWPLIDTLGDSVMVTIDTAFSDTTAIALSRKLLPEREYRLNIPAQHFSDLSANRAADPADSVVVQIAFETVALDSLCFSLSGGSSCLSPDPHRIWRFTALTTGTALTTPDHNGQFRYDSIPAAKGRLSYFSDTNQDGIATPGTLFPWQRPEPVHTFADTIEARARWDVEGVELNACETCPKPKTAIFDTSAASRRNAPGR